jgi:hypothetical protein
MSIRAPARDPSDFPGRSLAGVVVVVIVHDDLMGKPPTLGRAQSAANAGF